MSDALPAAIERLYHRVLSAVGIGRVSASRDQAGDGARLLQLRISEEETRDATPELAHYGFASRPKVGADAVVLFVGGNRSAGVVVATNDRRYRLELAEGEVALHTDEGDRVHLKRGRVVEIAAGAKLRIDAPLVEVTGRVEAAGDVKAGAVSLQQHVHTGVQPGGGLSGPPQP